VTNMVIVEKIETRVRRGGNRPGTLNRVDGEMLLVLYIRET